MSSFHDHTALETFEYRKRFAEHTEKLWEHQRELDARDHAYQQENCYTNRDNSAIPAFLRPFLGIIVTGGVVVGGAGMLLYTGVRFGMEGYEALVGGFTEGFAAATQDAPSQRTPDQVGIDVMPTVENPTYGYDGSTQHPCEIWANANPTLADKLVPGDRCWGF